MNTAHRRAAPGGSSTRRSSGRPPVPLDLIATTALKIVDEEGADALSMRALAQHLGSGTATLYRHFANRADLVAHVVDRVFGEVEIDADELAAMSWQQAVQTVAHSMFNAFRRHRNVALLRVGQLPVGPRVMALRERCLAVLLDNGFPPRLAIHSYATLVRYVLGFAIQLTDDTNEPLEERPVAALFRGADPALFPATVAVADSMPVPLEDEFAFGLELLLGGLTQLRDGQTACWRTQP